MPVENRLEKTLDLAVLISANFYTDN